MTTTDSRKRDRDIRDAHETARARDAWAKAGHPIEWFFYDETQTFTREHLTEALHVYLAPANPKPGDVVQYLGHATTQPRDAAWMLGALDGTGEPRTRTHHIDTETGEFTLLDNQEDTMDAPNEVKIHVTIDREQVREAARLAAELFITEYASRLVEAVDPNYLDDEPVEDCGYPPRVHVNPERTDWLDEPIPVPQPEPADITKEPPVGSQVTDGSGEVWERHEVGWALWWPERSGWVYELLGGDPSPWPVVRNRTPLRPTTDADRVRVGLPVEPAPADVDPDEALAKVAFGEYMLSPSWDEAEPDMRKAWIDVARAAREHIEAEDAAAHPVGCGQMIRDVRDGNGFSTQIDGVLIAKCDTYGRTKSESVANARADKAEADLARVTEERDGQTERLRLAYDALKKAEAKADRYDALRADLEDKFSQVEVEDRGNMPAFASRVLKGILDRDAERDGR